VRVAAREGEGKETGGERKGEEGIMGVERKNDRRKSKGRKGNLAPMAPLV